MAFLLAAPFIVEEFCALLYVAGVEAALSYAIATEAGIGAVAAVGTMAAATTVAATATVAGIGRLGYELAGGDAAENKFREEQNRRLAKARNPYLGGQGGSKKKYERVQSGMHYIRPYKRFRARRRG